MHGCKKRMKITMHFLFILFLLCCSNFAERVQEEPQVSEITSRLNTSIEQKPSKYRVSTSIYFSKSLPNNTKKVSNNDLKLKCEVVVNVSKVELEISRNHSLNKTESEEIVISKAPAHLIDNVTKTVKINWIKNNVVIVPDELKVSIKKTASSGLANSVLRIRKIDKNDEGFYTCSAISGYYVVNTTTKLTINENQRNEKEGEIPSYRSLYPTSNKEFPTTLTSDDTLHLSSDRETQFFTENVDNNNNKASTIPTELLNLKQIKPICQIYKGITCAHYLQGQYVYIPQVTTQVALEEKINIAFKVVSYSNDISSNCEGYALPSLCYSTFPICRNPVNTNEQFFKEVNNTQNHSNPAREILKGIDDDEPLNIQFENLPPSGLPAHLDPTKSNDIKKETRMSHNRRRRSDKFEIKIDTRNKAVWTEMLPQFDKMVQKSVKDTDPWHNTVHLRRVCRRDCEILENELCQKEYAIAKRHPHIGQQLSLEECENLPEFDRDCLAIGVDTVIDSDDKCYWENGVAYLGKVNVTKSSLPCIQWSQQMAQKLTNYPELAGGHSYCRNPGGIENQPWCFVEKDSKYERQLCEIPKCAHKIWIYIICIFAGLLVIFVALFVCLCCRNKNKHDPTTIRNINVPNADKNIYGNSRLNSPVEMNDFLQNQNSNLGPNGRNTRGNGVLRVPQYTLSQIKFLEELGEGAFGKVYKGALTKGNETTYVAVKALKENASAKTQSDFRREIDLISELRHDNIVCIVGVALREEPLCMLFEFMARGDLHEFLMGRAPPAGRGLPATRLLSIAHHIACGMQYLAAHHYVHRDLAARNCLVGDDFVVKISDFGLSRDIYSSDYYRVQSKSLLPVRWMPPESILYGKFTTESDIWSYGVVLWEIYSYGLQPYYGFSNQEVISRVRGGELLACPCSCPAPVYALMRECWRHQRARRPHFDEIAERLQSWVQSGTCETASSESSVTSSAQRATLSTGDPRERVPLLPSQCSSSNGSLATPSVRKLSIAGSSSSNNKLLDDNCSTSSDVPPSVTRHKKGSCGSLIDSDRQSIKDTVVRLQMNTPNPHDI